MSSKTHTIHYCGICQCSTRHAKFPVLSCIKCNLVKIIISPKKAA